MPAPPDGGPPAPNPAARNPVAPDPVSRGRRLARGWLVAFYGAAGAVHLARPDVFLKVMPGWVPFPRDTILATGAAELAGAAGLLVPRLRRPAGIGLALYAACVFPANIKHMLLYAAGGGTWGWLYHGPRMLAQPVIAWWALFAGGVATWPLDRSRRRAGR